MAFSTSGSATGSQGVIFLDWDPPLQDLPRALVARTQRLWVALGRLADNFATRITSWMQINASWKDQSGEARRRLHAEAFRAGMVFGITVAHGVPYGIFLETMQAGQYAVLMPAVVEWLPEFFRAVQELVKRIR